MGVGVWASVVAASKAVRSLRCTMGVAGCGGGCGVLLAGGVRGCGEPVGGGAAVPGGGVGVGVVLRSLVAWAALLAWARGARREAAGAVAAAPGCLERVMMRLKVGVSAPSSSTRPLRGVKSVGECGRLLEEGGGASWSVEEGVEASWSMEEGAGASWSVGEGSPLPEEEGRNRLRRVRGVAMNWKPSPG